MRKERSSKLCRVFGGTVVTLQCDGCVDKKRFPVPRKKPTNVLISSRTTRKYSKCVITKDIKQDPKMIIVTYKSIPDGTTMGAIDACLVSGTPACQEITRKHA